MCPCVLALMCQVQTDLLLPKWSDWTTQIVNSYQKKVIQIGSWINAMNGYANGIQIALFLQRVVVLARIGGREGDLLINMFFSHNLRSLVALIILCKYPGKICNVSHYSDMLQLSQIVCIFWNISVALAGTSRSCFAKSEENLTDPFLLLENPDILSRKCTNLTTIIMEASLCFFKHSTKQHFGLGLT